MKSIYIKERLDMSNLSRRIKASAVLFAFAAYMPLSLLPSIAAPGADSIGANTTPVLDSSINGGYVGLNPNDKNKFDVNLDKNLGAGGTAQFDWKEFNVGKDITVDWIFTNHSQTAINRVLNTGKISQIYGKLTSSCAQGDCGAYSTAGSGKVILINPNGILFGQGSQVNLNSFTASTYDISGMKDIKDAIKDGYLGGTLKSDVQYNGVNNYKFAGDDKLTANYKWDQKISFLPGTIGANGNGTIELDGSTFNGPTYDPKTNTWKKTNAKSVALISDKIDINNSTIHTFTSNGTEGNVANYGQSDSNVKIITSDGVTFEYSNYGTILENVDVKNKTNKTPGKDYGINIKNSQIESGSVQVVNGVSDTNLVIQDSTVVADKLYNGSLGQIALESTGDIVIKDSRVETIHGYNDDKNNPNSNVGTHGNIDITAINNVYIDNSRIQSAASTKNIGLDKAVVGNVNITAENGNVEITKKPGAVNSQVPAPNRVDIVAGGNLNISAQKGNVIVNLDGDTKLQAAGHGNGDLIIRGGDVEINNALLGANNIGIYSGSIDQAGNLIGSGALILNNTQVNSTNSLDLIGYNTTLTDSNLSYNDIRFYNEYMEKHGLLNNVEIKDGTTINDRKANDGRKDALVLETNGDLIITNNKLQRKGVSEVDPDGEHNKLQNQTADIKLVSKNGQVSIRNNSDITTAGSVTLDGKTNANISTSNVTAGKDINLIAGKSVTIGDLYEDGTTGKASNLNAQGNINLTSNGSGQAITVRNSNLNGKNNTINAKNGDIKIYSSNITAANNNDLDAAGSVTISRANGKNGSKLIAGNESDINAGSYIWVNKSEVTSNNANRLTANGRNAGDVVELQGATVTSNNGDVTITQILTMDINNQFHDSSAINAKGNINLNVNGTGENIKGESFEALTYGGRLNLAAANDIILESQDWDIKKVNFNAGHDTLISSTGKVNLNDTVFNSGNKNVISAVGNLLIQNAMNIQQGATTLTGGTVKTDVNGVINANSNKLAVNANTDIDIAFTGVDNKNKGLEINAGVNTANGNGDRLNGKNVTLEAKDGSMALAKVKADTLTIKNAENTKILAATDNKANAATDNISADTPNSYANKAYIEINKLAGWNMDNKNLDIPESMPGFYNQDQHFGLNADTGYHQNHFITFGDNENFTLTYKRAGGDCITPPEPSNPIISALDESALVRLPKHEQGVSAVAPVLNNITDPTANVIMAAARLTLDEEGENEDQDKF